MIENNAKIEEIRKEDKKAGKKFLIILILCTMAGGVTGSLGTILVDYTTNNGWDFIEFSKLVTELWVTAGAYLIIAVNVILLPLLWFFLSKNRKALEAWDGEDEEVYEKIDKKLSTGMTVASGLMVFNMLTFGVGFYGSMNNPERLKGMLLLLVVDLIFFIGSTACIVLYQKAMVNLLKEINPEKQGSVYDFKFQKKWLASCDEAEKQKIGEASYVTYSIMNLIYEIVAMVLMIVGFFFPIGVLPLTIVCLLWMTQVIIYAVKAR